MFFGNSIMGLWEFLPLIFLVVATTALPANTVISPETYEALGFNKSVEGIKTIYTSQHDIVNIIVPLTRYDEWICYGRILPPIIIFFVEADINDKGERDYQGLFVLKNGIATKIVDNGRDATALHDGSKKVYIGASDGIYIYDDIDGTTKKHGNLTDNIIKIEADNKAGIIYFVTNDHQVFSTADEGTKKNKVEELKDVNEIAIDLSSNIFYTDTKNDMYVFNQDGIKKIEGLPSGGEVKLATIFILKKAMVLARLDGERYYELEFNGGYQNHEKVSSISNVTAFAPDTGIVQIIASDKRIMEVNAIDPFCSLIYSLMQLSSGE